MSKVSQLYDSAITIVQTLLPNHFRLPNPYKVEENSETFLKQAFGIAFGIGAINNRLMSCQTIITREMRIPIVRKFYALESDPVNKAVTEKQLFEDQFLILKEFEKNTTLNEVAVRTTYVNDSGIQYVLVNRDHFMVVESVFAVEYFEDLN